MTKIILHFRHNGCACFDPALEPGKKERILKSRGADEVFFSTFTEFEAKENPEALENEIREVFPEFEIVE